MKAPQLLALVLSSIFSASYGMRQVELDNIEPLQQLSTFDGYQFGNTLGQDGFYSFYYLLPTSSRSEQRTASGEVTGQYAFVAPEGNEFEFRYNAGHEGYQVESNALPVPPEDTDEVKRAKEEFFAAYKKALELAGSDEDYEEQSEESDEDSSEETYYSEDSSEEDDSEEDSNEDSDESDEDSSEETYYSEDSSEEDDSEEDSEESSEEDSEESSEEKSFEDYEEDEEEEAEEEEEEEEEEGGEQDIPEEPAFGYRRLVQQSGFGQKIRKPYPYNYSR